MSVTNACLSRFAAALLVMLGVILASPASAQPALSGAQPLPAQEAFQLSAARQSDRALRVEWKIAPGYYLYADKFQLELASRPLELPKIEGAIQQKDDPTFGNTEVVHDHAALTIAPEDLTAGTLVVRYQGCQEAGICYPPVLRLVDVATLAITPSSGGSQTSEFSAWSAPPAKSETSIVVAEDGGGIVGALLSRGGIPMVLAGFVAFGVLLAFTPCVLPMYPILAGAIARDGETVTAKRGFRLSVVYVLGMAGAFGLLGVFAAWSGQNLQMVLQSPLAVGAVATLFFMLALSMFGLFELQLPPAWVNAVSSLGGRRRGSLTSAGVLGFTSALVVGPCVTAPLAGALIYIAQTGDLALGAASLFFLGLGKGVPLIAFGTLGPAALPKAGSWMTTVREACGLVFIVAAIMMISRLLPPQGGMALWALFAIGVAVWLGAFNALERRSSGLKRAAKATGIGAVFYGVILLVGAASGAGNPLHPLENVVAAVSGRSPNGEVLAFRMVGNTDDLQAQLSEGGGKPNLLYVTADWCVTCQAIERNVLPDEEVRAQLKEFNLIKLDVTENSPEQQQMMQSLGVVGPPTMIFANSAGREAASSRLIGSVSRASLIVSSSKASGNL